MQVHRYINMCVICYFKYFENAFSFNRKQPIPYHPIILSNKLRRHAKFYHAIAAIPHQMRVSETTASCCLKYMVLLLFIELFY
jgi:hypothetical protein